MGRRGAIEREGFFEGPRARNGSKGSIPPTHFRVGKEDTDGTRRDMYFFVYMSSDFCEIPAFCEITLKVPDLALTARFKGGINVFPIFLS